MFELSVAFKYLTPRWRQLSVSIISLISILVIALVVWLIVVFFSVTHGLEKTWIQKLISLTAPIRITPTDKYYKSYYYQVDTISAASNFAPKSIGEKLQATVTDPYDPNVDGEPPFNLKAPDLDANGQVKDLVKEVYKISTNLKNFPGLKARDFEMTVSNLSIQLLRHQGTEPADTQLSQTVYLGSFDPDNPALMQTSLLPLTSKDFRNFLAMHSEHIDSSYGTYVLRSQLLNNNAFMEALPSDPYLGEALLVPKSYRTAGVLLGDRGYLTYYTPTLSSVQEQHLPVFVAGFYDPGIISIGGKYVLANRDVISLIRGSQQGEESAMTNGINLRFDDLDQADQVKAELEKGFKEAGIEKYWRIETFREYEFTKDLIQQLSSERNLWTLLSTVIIIVACSNIISMLIILVNDKKLEIGILRAMGATSVSIAIIFGICGMVMGMIGSVIGMVAAFFTLQHLQALVNLIGRIQGFDMFNPLFYGNSLPNQISWEAVVFVVVATSIISLLAGIVPAVKASLLKPSIILRAE